MIATGVGVKFGPIKICQQEADLILDFLDLIAAAFIAVHHDRKRKNFVILRRRVARQAGHAVDRTGFGSQPPFRVSHPPLKRTIHARNG